MIKWAMTAVVAITLSIGVASAQEFKIRLSHSLSTSEPAHLASEFLAKNVSQRTNGRVSIEVFPGQQLGSEKDVNEMMRQGANLITVTDAGYLSDFVPDMGIMAGPYLFKTPEDQTKLISSDWFKDIEQKFDKAGIRFIIKNGYFGQRHLISDKPVRHPRDIAGMTVRVPPNTVFVETFKAMGARPVTVQWSEVYNGLQQNVVSGAEAPLGSLWGAKLHEARKTISLTGHFTAFNYWVINARYMQSLPADIQKILIEEGIKAGEYKTKLTKEKNDEYLDLFRKAGVTIISDVDTDEFREATKGVYGAFPKWTPGLYEKVSGIVAGK